MARGHRSESVNPFDGLAESVVTSNVIDTRGAFDITLSWHTTSGTTSVHTYQISNDPAGDHNDTAIAELSWSHWTTFGESALALPGSGSTTLDPPLGYAWARILRSASGSSASIWVNKTHAW